MEKIYQGSNDPLILTIDDDLTKYEQISAVLVKNHQALKEWDMSNITIDGQDLILPLEESDTISMPFGIAKLDAKAYRVDGSIAFFVLIDYLVIPRENKHRFVGGEI